VELPRHGGHHRSAGPRQLAAPAGYATDDLTGEAFFPTGDGRAFFFGETADRLWITDGTAAGTQPVRSFGDAPGSSGPQEQAALGGKLIFSALATDASLPSLFASDGTAGGTRRLKNAQFSHPALLGGRVLFSGYSELFGAERWKIDSLSRPVDLLKNIDPFYDDLNPSSGQFCVAESSRRRRPRPRAMGDPARRDRPTASVASSLSLPHTLQ
jgi:ELWxxDGT repeat protein